jgi:hypothetical protein
VAGADCSERKVLLAGCWWLDCSERRVLLADKPSEQADDVVALQSITIIGLAYANRRITAVALGTYYLLVHEKEGQA